MKMGVKSVHNKIDIVDGKINFICLGEECPTPCCGRFTGINNNIEPVFGKGFHEIYLTEADMDTIRQNGYSFYTTINHEGKYVMALNEDTSCKAFCGGKCAIHEYKPTLCRAFPFYFDMFVGLCGITGECPGFGEGWTPVKDLFDDIKAACKMYEFWLGDISRFLPKE